MTIIKLIKINDDKYPKYRLDAMFDCYKWDPYFLDNNTIAQHVLILTKEEHELLKKYTEELDEETRNGEVFLNAHKEYIKPLALPRGIRKDINNITNYDPQKNIRLMRYDFHPVENGDFALSEVNSDVPGGFAESSLLPVLAKNTIGENNYTNIDFSESLINAIVSKTKANGNIMLVHCTSYSDDRQVMQFLGDKLEKLGFHILYGAGDHVVFKDNEAYSILSGNECKLDAIIRFTPLEWMIGMKPKRWGGYFYTTTTSCNHPIAIYAQTKRFPLVWDELEKNGISMQTWRKLLPDTIEVKDVKGKEGYIFKPACGRVGENISIKEACSKEEYSKILKDVKRHPKQYLAQKMFKSRPIKSDDGEEFHVCLGSYSVDGKHAGYYARLSRLPRIDSNAQDIPVLIEQ
ncbi:MAG: glutathionylspermidine synthase family protein [Clostridia bacterium]|nr:glutathionylspermidine synthase family protein [Clostridia bacterium]